MNEIEKYKELFFYAKNVYDEEISRFIRLDEKASRYLSVYSIYMRFNFNRN